MAIQEGIRAAVFISFIGILILLLSNQGLWWDEAVYLALSKAIPQGHYSLDPAWPLESFRPPVFPFLLSIFSGFSDAVLISRIFVFILASLSAAAVYFLSKEIFNKKTALWSLLLFSTSYLFIFFSTKILSEPLFIIFLSLSVFYFSKSHKAKNKNYLILSGLFAGLAFLTRYIGFILILAYFICFVYLCFKGKIRPFNILYFAIIIFIISTPWILLSVYYYQEPFGGFITNIKVFAQSPPNILVQNYLSLFGYEGIVSIFIPALILFAIYFSVKQRPSIQQKFIFLLFFLSLAYFVLLPYKEIRYLLSFLPIISALAAFGLVQILEKSKQYKVPIITTVLILSIVSMLAGFQSAWENSLASLPVIEASQYLNSLQADSVLTQMYPYVNYFSSKRAIQFCENHFVNPDFEKCQEELITNNFNPEKIPNLMEKYNTKYILFYRFEPTNPPKVFAYLESNPQFRKVKSFEEFGTEAAVIYEYVG